MLTLHARSCAESRTNRKLPFSKSQPHLQKVYPCHPFHIYLNCSSFRRTLTSRTFLRPSILPPHSSFQAGCLSLPNPDSAILCTSSLIDILPKISTHPALASTQVRNGPRNTFDPSHRVRKRRSGFLARLRTRKGRNTLTRRKVKGRSTLSH